VLVDVARSTNADATTEAVHSAALIHTTAITAHAMKDINWHQTPTTAQVSPAIGSDIWILQGQQLLQCCGSSQ